MKPFGVMLNGKGQVWFDDLKFEIVDKSVPTTDFKGPTEPQNLSFDE